MILAASTDQTTQEMRGSLAEHSVPGLRSAVLCGWKKGKDGQWDRKNTADSSSLPAELGPPNTHAKDTQGFGKCCTLGNNQLPTDIPDTLFVPKAKVPRFSLTCGSVVKQVIGHVCCCLRWEWRHEIRAGWAPGRRMAPLWSGNVFTFLLAEEE